METLYNETDICQNDLECADNEMCFADTDWFKHHLPELLLEDRVLGCVCNQFYRFQGENCSNLARDTIFYIMGYVVLLLFNLWALYFSGPQFLFNFFQTFIDLCDMKFVKIRLGYIFSSPKTYINICTFFGICGSCLWCLEMILSSSIRSGPFLAEEQFLQRDPYKGRFSIIGFWGGGASGALLGVAALALVIFWSFQAHLKMNESKYDGFVFRKRGIVTAFIFAIVVSLIVSNVYSRLHSQKVDILGIFTLPPLLYIFYCSTRVSYKLFKKKINDMEKKTTIKSTQLTNHSIENVAGVQENVHIEANNPSRNNLSQVTVKDRIRHVSNWFSLLKKAILETQDTQKSLEEMKTFADTYREAITGNVQENTPDATPSPSKQGRQITQFVLVLFITLGTFLLMFSLFVWSMFNTVKAKNDFPYPWRENMTPDTGFSWLKFTYFLRIVAVTILGCSIAAYIGHIPGPEKEHKFLCFKIKVNADWSAKRHRKHD